MENVKSMSKAELARAYNICPETLSNWITRARLIPDLFTDQEYRSIRIFTPHQVKTIFEKLGEP